MSESVLCRGECGIVAPPSYEKTSFGYLRPIEMLNRYSSSTINYDLWCHSYVALTLRINRTPGPFLLIRINSSHKGQWGGALMFSLICAWVNGWVNNHEAGDFRRHRAHYDVTVMWGLFYIPHSEYIIQLYLLEWFGENLSDKFDLALKLEGKK